MDYLKDNNEKENSIYMYDASVIGGGLAIVGLPLSTVLANEGKKSLQIYDINEKSK
ncbi:hypothetical protein OFP68_13980 [Brachyspira hyodysenteriae]|uniref:hypothetical protein n=1 Tax=Brachyspira hyodysenteriae TaxID=159 RepID=UPI0022CD68BB|nr:hypothetical protein [Brachyspira hyodysenteriae]MCZ9879981.1 hypothetical protein [Brachyspira hyodysenteriae]